MSIEPVLKHIEQLCVGALRGKTKPDRFAKLYNDEPVKLNLEEFIRDPENRTLVVCHPSPERLDVLLSIPETISKKALYMLKSDAIVDQLSLDDMKSNVICAEITPNHLHSLKLLAQEVYFPLLSNPANRTGWSGPTAKEVMLNFSGFLSNLTMTCGQTLGQTLLPPPPPEAFDEDNLPEKERVHLLETSVIQWSDKIQQVLATDPETVLKQGKHPGPLVELDFWIAKAKDLKALDNQITSPLITDVIGTLSELKSPLASEFKKLSRRVIACRDAASENARYLQTLQPYFVQLHDCVDFPTLEESFIPMLHTMMLIWQHSTSYSSQDRLLVLVQEICNAIVAKAAAHISGEVIFRLIEDENVPEALMMIKQTLGVCQKFIDRFHRQKVKVDKILKPGAWDVPEDLLFVRLNTFIERGQDILEFCRIVTQFHKLEKIFVGGTKGDELTESIHSIHEDFKKAVVAFQSVPYDPMDITASSFDDDFYKYRTEVKELERRLSFVLTSGFDDCSTLAAKFQLLDSFEDLLSRPALKNGLDRKRALLLSEYSNDLHQITLEFHRNKDDPHIDNNLPPVAGRLQWCRALLTRMTNPLNNIVKFTAATHPEETKEVQAVYQSILSTLKDYEIQQTQMWITGIDDVSTDRLSLPLLTRDRETTKLIVNFDPDLVCLLREVKYFLLLKLEVPETALEVYSKAERYRRQIGVLEQTVQMYNEMIETLHHLEKPLVEKDLAHIDQVVEAGIVDLDWNNPGVDKFIEDAVKTVQTVYDMVKVMKNNMEAVKEMMAGFASVPLADRKNKPQSPADFEEGLRKLWSSRHQLVHEHQESVTKLLAETNEALNVNKGSPVWRAYVEYVQDGVRDGLAACIVNSIKFMCEQLDLSLIERNNLAPLLEIKLGLYANDVLFNAEETTIGALDDNVPRKSRRDVWQIVNDWVEGFFEIGNIMTRVDGSHYVGDLKKNEGIVRFINTLKKHLDINNKDCETFRQEYLKFEFLWKTDRQSEFNKFLANATKPETKENKYDQVNDEDDEDTAVDGVGGNAGDNEGIMPLDKFEERIMYYKELQAEIADKESIVDIGWIKVDAKPIKSALITWTSKWINTFTSFLYNDVTRKLHSLDELMKEVGEGLQAEVPHGDSEALKKVLGHIHQIRSREKSTVKMFQPMRDTVSLLKKHGRNLDEYELKLLSDAPIEWDNTVINVYKVKEKVNSLQNELGDKIKTEVADFEDRLVDFTKEFKARSPCHHYDYIPEEAYEIIFDYHEKMDEFEAEAHKLAELERVFELTVSSHHQLKTNRHDNKNLKVIWDMVSVVKHTFESWKRTLWDEIDTDILLIETKKLQKQIEALPSEIRSWKVYKGLLDEVMNLRTVLPLVNLLSSLSMQDRHWTELKMSTKKQFDKGPDFCLANLLDLELHDFVQHVEYIVELANKESKIGGNLTKISANWNKLNLDFGKHKNTDISIISTPDEILVALEENMATLQGMMGQGQYVQYFLTEVTKWQKALSNTETVLFDWLEVQRNWSSLESIFLSSRDIRVQLPEDSKRFDKIDSQWKELMKSAETTPLVLDACSQPGRAELLINMKTGLEQCEKSLFMYLETKRMAFPRFYFLSNAALLDILSNGYNPQAVQKHLGDCFDNIASLTFEEQKDPEIPVLEALGMHSKDGGEYVPFHEIFHCDGAVEDWLNALVLHMRATLRDILSKAKFTADHWELEKPRRDWLYDYPAQIALTASQLVWTEEVTSQFEAIADGNEQAMKEYAKTLAARLEKLIELVLNYLEKRDRIKIITLITVDVHNRDVVQKLIDAKVQDASVFLWQSQMRMKWEQDTKDCVIMIADFAFRYAYEYVGNTGRLVITPLTDRCYITLTQALRLIMGGAPAGPAGTGKTETTKDLGRAMGLPVYVFNCSEQMNVQSMSAVYKGLAQTGAWGCFDEFNRIPIEVLSVVSTQVSCVLNAIRDDKKEFNFLDEMIKLVPSVGMFITMNPGYAGRTELPENLKALFRSCAMVVPDIQLICENMLMSEGFLQARRLSKKFTTLYGLSKELLSKQMHYDWGLRATKAVLRVAGGLKRAEPDVFEDRILMRALRDFNLPKLVDEDKPIFIQLCNDLFPGLGNTQRKMDMDLKQAIIDACIERKIQPENMFVSKCVELAELLDIRHSVFVIGPAACGKTECWKTLMRAFNNQGKVTVNEIINPKAVRNNELYGWLSKTDWHDGILSTVMRNMSRNNHPYNESQTYKWIILDGDIDPEWIESLNTVMDDNKVLTLVSNERIPFTAPMRALFEIANLDNATPATVSRAGIIFINAGDVGSGPFLDSWLKSRDNEKEESSLLALFQKYTTSELLTEMVTKFKRVVPLNEICMVKTLCYLLEGLLAPKKGKAKKVEQKLDHAAAKELFEANFIFATIWAFGGALIHDKTTDYVKDFSEWWKTAHTTVKFPKDGTVFDYFPDPATGKMTAWDDVVPAYEPPYDAYLVTKVFVPTVVTTRLTFLTDLLASNQRPVQLVGLAGTGKTSIMVNFLKALDEGMTFSTVNLNYYTDAKALQAILESYIDKRSGRVFGPPGSKKLIYFIDDLNMPFVDTYGTQSPHALIRQHLDYGIWYDTTKLEKKEIIDVQYIACMNPTAGSFTINPRLQGQFATFAVLLPNTATLMSVYQKIISHHFGQMKHKGIMDMTDTLVKATIDLHDDVSTNFIPSSRKFHYQFNLRDLSSVFQGVCSCAPDRGYKPPMIVDLWAHEAERVYGDRLVNPEDLRLYRDLSEIRMKKSFRQILDGAKRRGGGDEKEEEEVPNIFTSFCSGTEIKYLPIKSLPHLKGVLEEHLRTYNENNPIMNLELFGDAMFHVTRICRIIENPRGNALLVGVGGSGKQSLTKLATYICNYDLFQISVTQTYGINDLKADLQELYKKCGVKRIPLVFMLTDAQIVDDEWLVYINDLLSSGYIPDLFNQEDKDVIFSSIRNEAKAQGVQDSPQAMQDFFIATVRANLHVVLCFSPVGSVFRVRCRKFPAIINCTSIDWFHPWPRDALISVAYRFLQDTDCGDDHIRQQVAEHMAHVHTSVDLASQRYLEQERRYNYTTPKSFLELIDFYKLLLGNKRDNLAQKTDRLVRGITTLRSTQEDVAQLKEDLTVTLVKVKEKAASANKLIEKTGIERKKVEDQQAIAAVEAEKARQVSAVANEIAAECKRDLEAALPIMEKAKEAVNCLTKASLTTLKSFATPPGNVLYVTNAVLILKDMKGKRDWASAKKMMKNVSQFMNELKEFDATSIDESIIRKLQPILAKSFFNANDMKSSSEAAANLCGWVVNIVAYNSIYKEVAPKIAAQKKASEEYDAALAKLRVVEERVAGMKAKLKIVTDELTAATEEKAQVEAEAQNCQDRLALAKRLVEGLADENERWGKSVEQFRVLEGTLVGDVMLGASFVSYLGAFNASFRNQLWKNEWTPDLIERKVPLQEDLDPLLVLADQSDFAKWKNEGLAADRISLENGAIMTQSTRWPLMIDPQLQGIKWIKNRVADLKVIQLSQSKWLRTLIDSVSNGYFVLIESAPEELDATLDPILTKAIIKRGKGQVIKLAGEEVDYDLRFRLILQTKLANPHYKPEVAAQCTLVNFIVTEEGLEDQLLALVVNKEKPELEEKRTGLVRAINDYMVSLTDLENELLQRLSDAPDDILSDVALIEGLEKTKLASKEIEQKVELAKKQEIDINAARNEYRGVAAEGSWLYFLLNQLNVIDHMYQYSLDAFISFFYKAMTRAEKAETTVERVRLLRESIRIVVFTWVNRGLFEKHKLILTSQLCFKLMLKGALSEKYNPANFNYLIRGPKATGADKKLDWLPHTAWYSIQALIKLEGFQRLATDMEQSPNRFKEWYNKGRPEGSPLPLEWRKLDDNAPFMKLMVVRAMRLDRMTAAMEGYVRKALPHGKSFTECDAGKSFQDVLASSLDDSTPVTPIFFILSPGADPVQTVETLAKRAGLYNGRFFRVALGQGMDVVAMRHLDQGVVEGHWVVLENIHLMPAWCRELEKKLEKFAAEGKQHPDFRVFLSAEPSNAIPIGLLDGSIKLTNEPPQGLKQNLKRAFASFDKDEFEFKDVKVKNIIFGLCHFHSVIIERIKFGAKGWNRPYPFNTGDLMCSATVLTNYLENSQDKIPWSDLRYIFGEILYGGHITDDWDRLLCNTYLNFYMREELLDEMQLFPFNEQHADEQFMAPPVLPFDQYFEYIDHELQFESPVAFGMHPNAEIAVMTDQAEALFSSIMELQPREGGSGSGDTSSPLAMIQTVLSGIQERIRGIHFNLEDVRSLVVDDCGPYQIVFLQECDRMNMLIDKIDKALAELELGLNGELQMSARMEQLQDSLYLGRVPASWERMAYPSGRALMPWVEDMLLRAGQLSNWTDDPTSIPLVVQLNYLFNPQSFLTAIMQKTAQKQSLELDKLIIQTDVTRKTLEQTDSRARDGAYITGLFLEGARWNWNVGVMEESMPREMYFAMPVITARAILADKMEKNGVYRCPVYKTQIRGPTYVFTASLRSKLPAAKWVLAGVVMTMEIVE